jgi:hypothetical protein
VAGRLESDIAHPDLPVPLACCPSNPPAYHVHSQRAAINMDSSLVTATAALLGSLAGASASIFTTWMTQRSQLIRERAVEELRRRELLYEDFIKEASNSVIDALSNSLDRPDKFVKLYANLSCIRLLSSQPVLAAAEACCGRIVDLYSKPNLSVDQIRTSFQVDHFDPLREFSAACRAELHAISR